MTRGEEESGVLCVGSVTESTEPHVVLLLSEEKPVHPYFLLSKQYMLPQSKRQGKVKQLQYARRQLLSSQELPQAGFVPGNVRTMYINQGLQKTSYIENIHL